MKALYIPLILLATLIAVVPAGAQVLPFEAEVDCDGIFSGGQSVPFLLEFSNRTLEPKTLDMTLTLSVPGAGDRTLFQRQVPLNPNQDRFINRQLNLPASLPNGEYVMTITATDGVDATFDTCSFHVVS